VSRAILAPVLLLLLAGVGSAEEPSPADGERQVAAMVQTVLDQLAAFRRGDWAGAYAYAAEGIRARFSLDAFRVMVTQGYGPIARSSRGSVRGVQILDPRHGVVAVRVEGQDGQLLDAVYELVREQEAWRIAGVVAEPVDGGVTTQAPAPAPAAVHPTSQAG
jgi:hypothetical protein